MRNSPLLMTGISTRITSVPFGCCGQLYWVDQKIPMPLHRREPTKLRSLLTKTPFENNKERGVTKGIPLSEISEAAERIKPWVHRTPLLSSRRIGEAIGAELWLKAECLQKTGSFKPRGATNRVLTLSDSQRAAGLVTVSAGNHAQGLAYAAGNHGVACTVVMPASAPKAKIEATKGYGASVELTESMAEAFDRVYQLRDEGLTLAHPFDDPMVIAGQGTIGLEIVADLPEFDLLVVPIGGGGLISGIASAIEALRLDVRIYGVEPHGAATLHLALGAGEPVSIVPDTIADGLAAPIAGDLTLPIVAELVEDVVLVDDAQIAQAMATLAASAKLVTEGAGAAATAALLSDLIPLNPGDRVVAVCSGGNVDMSRFAELTGSEKG